MKISSKHLFLLPLLFTAFLLQRCDDNTIGFDFSEVPAPFNSSQAVKDSTLEDGSQLYILEEGDGPFEVVPNDRIEARFTARTASGEVFESTYRLAGSSTVVPNLKPNAMGNIPSTSPVVLIQRLQPFRKAFLGMKEGGKRIIEIPASSGLNGRYPITRIDLEGKKLIIDFELLQIF